MERLLLVALGGAIGSMARYLTGVGAMRLIGPRTLWAGTFTVNIVGGLLMGLLVGVLAFRGGADQDRWRLFAAVGVLGGFTTFSSFSLDAALLIQRREWMTAGAYVAASVAFSIGALFAGLAVARRLLA
ncbi:MAG TPA: fluoride efflux transporter CrcB [Caulobacteraceae bacterium]